MQHDDANRDGDRWTISIDDIDAARKNMKRQFRTDFTGVSIAAWLTLPQTVLADLFNRRPTTNIDATGLQRRNEGLQPPKTTPGPIAPTPTLRTATQTARLSDGADGTRDKQRDKARPRATTTPDVTKKTPTTRTAPMP